MRQDRTVVVRLINVGSSDAIRRSSCIVLPLDCLSTFHASDARRGNSICRLADAVRDRDREALARTGNLHLMLIYSSTTGLPPMPWRC